MHYVKESNIVIY